MPTSDIVSSVPELTEAGPAHAAPSSVLAAPEPDKPLAEQPHAGLSPATRRAYAADLRAFEAWCERRDLARGPEATERDLLFAYLVSLLRAGRSLGTARRRLSALRAHSRALRQLGASEEGRLVEWHRVNSMLPVPGAVSAETEGRADATHEGAAAAVRSVLVVADDPIVRAGTDAVLTAGGALCWPITTDRVHPRILDVWDVVLLLVTGASGLDQFREASLLHRLDRRLLRSAPVLVVHMRTASPTVRLRFAEAGASALLPYSWLLEAVSAGSPCITRATVPARYRLPAPEELRRSLGLRAQGSLETLLAEALELPAEVWSSHLPQSRLPIARSEVLRMRRVAYEGAGLPAPDFARFASSVRRAPELPEWSSVRAIVQSALGLAARRE